MKGEGLLKPSTFPLFFRSTDLRENEYYKKYYVFWSKFILIEVIPYAAIIVFNALILAKTVKAAKFRRKFGHSGGGGGGNRR